jgi:hypothetical protein
MINLTEDQEKYFHNLQKRMDYLFNKNVSQYLKGDSENSIKKEMEDIKLKLYRFHNIKQIGSYDSMENIDGIEIIYKKDGASIRNKEVQITIYDNNKDNNNNIRLKIPLSKKFLLGKIIEFAKMVNDKVKEYKYTLRGTINMKDDNNWEIAMEGRSKNEILVYISKDRCDWKTDINNDK